MPVMTTDKLPEDFPFAQKQTFDSVVNLCGEGVRKNYAIAQLLSLVTDREPISCTVMSGNYRYYLVILTNILHYILLYSEALGLEASRKRFGIHMEQYGEGKGKNKSVYSEEWLISDKKNHDMILLKSFGGRINFISSREPEGVYPFKFLIDLVFPDDPTANQEFREQLETLPMKQLEHHHIDISRRFALLAAQLKEVH